MTEPDPFKAKLYQLMLLRLAGIAVAFAGLVWAATDRFGATGSRQRMSLKGRPLPTADVGSPVAQLGGHLSGGELARPTGAGRPKAVKDVA